MSRSRRRWPSAPRSRTTSLRTTSGGCWTPRVIRSACAGTRSDYPADLAEQPAAVPAGGREGSSGRVDGGLGATAGLSRSLARGNQGLPGRCERSTGGLAIRLDLRQQRRLRVQQPGGVADVGALVLDLGEQVGAGRLVVGLLELLLQLPQRGAGGAHLGAGDGALSGHELAQRAVGRDVRLSGLHYGSARVGDLGRCSGACRGGSRCGVVSDSGAGGDRACDRTTGEERGEGRAGERTTKVELHGDNFLEVAGRRPTHGYGVKPRIGGPGGGLEDPA